MRNLETTVRDWRTSASGDRVVKVGLWTGSPWRYTITGITWDRERVRDLGRYHAIRRDKTHIVIALEASGSLWVKSSVCQGWTGGSVPGVGVYATTSWS